jgi:hypothetical protein
MMVLLMMMLIMSSDTRASRSTGALAYGTLLTPRYPAYPPSRPLDGPIALEPLVGRRGEPRGGAHAGERHRLRRRSVAVRVAF